MIKDISRFKNRDIRRTVLLDPKPVNYIMTPENSMPVMEYTAEYASGKNDMTDYHLLGLIEELEDVSTAIKFGSALPRGVVSLAILPVHKHPKWFGSCWETEVKEGEGSKLPVRAGLLVTTGFTGALGAARW